MTASAKTPRNRLLAAVHAAKNNAGLDDADYRAMLERITGHTSARYCSENSLRAVLDHLNGAAGQAGKPASARQADTPVARKCRALWLSLYWLDVIEDRRETALLAFLERQTGKKRFEWLTPVEADKVIEALKAMGVRAGVDWSPIDIGGEAYDRPNIRVAEAIWRALAQARGVKNASNEALELYAARFLGLGRRSLPFLGRADQIALVRHLGERLHKQSRDKQEGD